ncbi:MAG: HNH endonuclease, partial [Candidatus Eremiobacteraeota bacterium]|nr:HNH endonuclease [Candidatus Eremiobacteraeota bacterium]
EFLDRVETGGGLASGSLAVLKECKPAIGPGGPRERDSESEPPSAPRTIRVVFELTPDQYALYEQAESRVRAQEGRRVPRAEVLQRMAESVLAQGTAKARARHQVLVHTTEGSDEAWYETERGVLPVAPEVLKEALGGQEVLYSDGTSESRSEERLRNHSCDSGTKRTAVPNGVIRRVFARAGHRCECCGRKGGRLDVHHRTPVSEGGGNEPDFLELLCRACHTKNHELDSEEKSKWRADRGKALELSKQAFRERNRIGLNCGEPGIRLFQFGSD